MDPWAPHGPPVAQASTHCGQDILAVAIEHKALPIEGDHVALPVEGAGGWAVGTLLARPRPPRADAVGGAGHSGVTGAHAPP